MLVFQNLLTALQQLLQHLQLDYPIDYPTHETPCPVVLFLDLLELYSQPTHLALSPFLLSHSRSRYSLLPPALPFPIGTNPPFWPSYSATFCLWALLKSPALPLSLNITSELYHFFLPFTPPLVLLLLQYILSNSLLQLPCGFSPYICLPLLPPLLILTTDAFSTWRLFFSGSLRT